MRGNVQFGVDIPQPLCHNFRFSSADCGMERADLAVDIRKREHVVIDDIHTPNTATGECFDSITSHTAKPEYDYAGVF